MKNLEQIRAAQALKFWNSDPAKKVPGREASEIVRKLPALLLTNGLLATIASAKAGSEGWKIVMEEIGSFLSPGKMGILPAPAPRLDNLITVLTNELSDSLLLQRATAESLAYAGYLRRFAPGRQNSAEE